MFYLVIMVALHCVASGEFSPTLLRGAVDSAVLCCAVIYIIYIYIYIEREREREREIDR